MPPLPQPNRWLTGLWDALEQPITFAKLANQPPLRALFFIGANDNLQDTMEQNSTHRIHRIDIKIGEALPRACFIGYCQDTNLMYYDVYIPERGWNRAPADGINPADVPEFRDTWVREVRGGTEYMICDTFDMELKHNEGVWEKTTVIPDYRRSPCLEGFASFKTLNPDATVSFKTKPNTPDYNDFVRAFPHYWYDRAAQTTNSLVFSIKTQNHHLANFEFLGFKPSNHFGMGFEFYPELTYDRYLTEIMELLYALKEELVPPINTSNWYHVYNQFRFADPYPWIEFTGRLSDVDLTNLDMHPNDDLSSSAGEQESEDDYEPIQIPEGPIPGEPVSGPQDLAADEGRIGWESSGKRKIGYDEMSVDVIRTMQLEVEWLADDANNEKHRKYKEARDNLSELDKGYFRIQHGKHCGISFEELFLDVDPSKHEYRFVNGPVVVLDCGHMFLKHNLKGWRQSGNMWRCPSCNAVLKRHRALARMLLV